MPEAVVCRLLYGMYLCPRVPSCKPSRRRTEKEWVKNSFPAVFTTARGIRPANGSPDSTDGRLCTFISLSLGMIYG